MRRLPAAGTMLLSAVLGAAWMAPARADGASYVTGVVDAPSPLAGVVNAVTWAMADAHCNVNDPRVRQVQGVDGFAVALGGAAAVVDGAPETPVGSPPALPDFDVYFFDGRCRPAGMLSTAAVHERCGDGGPAACPTDARYAVVTMTAGADAGFVLQWALA